MDEPPERESEEHPLPFHTLADPELLGPAARFERWLRLAVLPFIGANVLLISLLVATIRQPGSAGNISAFMALAACIVFALALAPASRAGREFGLYTGVSLVFLALSAYGNLGLWIGPMLYAVIVAITYRATKISFLAVLPFAYGPLSWVILFPGEIVPRIIALVAIAAAATVCLLRRFFILGNLLTLAVIAVSGLVLFAESDASPGTRLFIAGLVLLIVILVFGLEIAIHRDVPKSGVPAGETHTLPSDFRLFLGQAPFVILSLLLCFSLVHDTVMFWIWFVIVLVGELLLVLLRPYAFGAALAWVGVVFSLAWRTGVSLHGSLPSLIVLIVVCALLAQIGFVLRNGFLRTAGVVLLALATFPNVFDLHYPLERCVAFLSLAVIYLLSVAEGFSLGVPWWQGFMTLEAYDWLTKGVEKVRTFLDSNFITRAIHAAFKAVIAWAVYLKGGQPVTLLDVGAIYSFAGLAFIVRRSTEWGDQFHESWLPFLNHAHMVTLWEASAWAVAGTVGCALGVFNGLPLQRAAGFILILVPALSWKEWAQRDLIGWCLLGAVAGLACVVLLLFPRPRTGRALSLVLRKGFLQHATDDNRRAVHPEVLACVFVAGVAAAIYGSFAADTSRAVDNISSYFDQMLVGESPEARQKKDDEDRAKRAADQQADDDRQAAQAAAAQKTADDARNHARQKILREAGTNLPQEAQAAVDKGGYVNSLGMAFVPVPKAGVDFSIWDVRVRDYDAYLEQTHFDPRKRNITSSRDPATPYANGRYLPGFKQTPDDPVVMVTGDEANIFCAWLTDRDRAAHLITKDKEYRLPYLSEWKAADEVDAANYNEMPGGWSQGWPPDFGLANIGGDLFPHTSPVGAFPPNSLGLYDVIGNVSQWCFNGYFEIGGGDVFVGGLSFADSVDPRLKPNYAGTKDFADRDDTLGFRCVLSPVNKGPVPLPKDTDP